MGSHYQYDWARNTGRLFSNTSQLQPGDLIFFDTGSRSGGGANLNGASHVGMYLGNGQFMHAANPSQGTLISNLNDYMNRYPYLGATHMSWSGGAAGAPGVTGGGFSTAPQSLQQRMFGW
jgi:cell wall-associated NlpC family hydrolase